MQYYPRIDSLIFHTFIQLFALWHKFEGFCNVHNFNFHPSTSGIFGLVEQIDTFLCGFYRSNPCLPPRIFHRSMWSVPLAGIVFWKRILIYDFFSFLSLWPSNCSWFARNVLDSTCNLPISRALLRIKWVSVSFTHLRYVTRISWSGGSDAIMSGKKKKEFFFRICRLLQVTIFGFRCISFCHFTILYLSIINIRFLISKLRIMKNFKDIPIVNFWENCWVKRIIMNNWGLLN